MPVTYDQATVICLSYEGTYTNIYLIFKNISTSPYIFFSCLLSSTSSIRNYTLSSTQQPTNRMASTDLEQLIDMGFDKERAELAVKKTGGRKFKCSKLPPLRHLADY